MKQHQSHPERGRGESLDETIDRVAAHLTMVPADPALAGRIAEQLDRDAPFGWPRLVMASAAVAALIVAFVFFNDARDVAPIDIAHTAVPAPASDAAAPRDGAPSGSEPDSIERAAITLRRAPAAEALEPLPEMRQLESLQSPGTLAVDTLATDELTIAPVDLAPLDMADLAVREIGNGDSSKE